MKIKRSILNHIKYKKKEKAQPLDIMNIQWFILNCIKY